MVSRYVTSGFARWGKFGLLLGSLLLVAAAPVERRVPPPTWDEVPPGIFFTDAFEQGLVGTPNVQRSPAVSSSTGEDVPASESDSPKTDSSNWREVISAETIEDEIKLILARTAGFVQNASDFKARGYRQARREFSIAAMLFAIVHEYPDAIRWQQDALSARDAFAQGALRAQVGSDSVLQLAEQLRIALEDLVRGGSFSHQAAVSPAGWPEICARSPLMQRLEMADSEQLASPLASSNSFQQERTRAVHEAELVAAIAAVLRQPGMDDAADQAYCDHCEAMQQAARAIVQAVENDDYEAARQAQGKLKKSCTDCHADYRG
jgi:hypothetical protein